MIFLIPNHVYEYYFIGDGNTQIFTYEDSTRLSWIIGGQLNFEYYKLFVQSKIRLTHALVIVQQQHQFMQMEEFLLTLMDYLIQEMNIINMSGLEQVARYGQLVKLQIICQLEIIQ